MNTDNKALGLSVFIGDHPWLNRFLRAGKRRVPKLAKMLLTPRRDIIGHR